MIEVIETAPLNSVQDLGRVGMRKFGMSPAGGMDRLALAIANAVLGNPRGAAAIEFQMFPVRLRILADTGIAVTGADCNARLDGRVLPPWWAIPARAGQVLELEGVTKGVRGYMGVAGGIDVPIILGSRSTSLRDGFGGLDGRALAAGDVLRSAELVAIASRDAQGFGVQPPSVALAFGTAGPRETLLRVIPAAEYPQFDDASQTSFWNAGWTITPRSNRQGYQLAGAAPLLRTEALEMRSHAIVPGTIQVPPSGQPIIQLADANSAGGYPKIGVVIDADLWRIAQAAPGQILRFVECDVKTARAAARDVATYLSEVERLSSYVWSRRAA
ncbi:MAG: biotin-dependent carboxyltransferase family protein [Proteobacteria bacterium]|nr:biotin-dependent carboxyltransferase family protein [Pseudomonadota bacterium]